MNIFFYGLFMDETLLRGQGLNPSGGERGFVKGYGLRIGERALLVESAEEKVFGVVFSLKESEAKKLYSAPGVKEYRPFNVSFSSLGTGNTSEIVCYNLPAATVKGSNAGYAHKLAEVLTSLHFPAEYISSVTAQAR